MSHRKDLYQATATLAGGALAIASGTPLAGATAIGISLAHLIGLMRDRKDADLSAAIDTARNAAEAALRDNREFSDSDFARAKALLDTAPRCIDPTAYARAARNGPPEPQITADLLSAIDFQPDDDASRRLLELLLDATVRTIWAHPSMQGSISRAFDVQIAQQAYRTEEKVDDLRELLLRHLDRFGEAAFARESGITDARIVALAQQVAEDVRDPEQAFRELEAAIAHVIAYRNAPAFGANADAALSDLRARLEALADAGKLAEAQQEANAALARWEAEEADRQAQATQAGIAYLNEALRRDLDMRDPEAAAAKLARRVALETPNLAARFDALRAEWLIWYERGRDKGLRLDLEVAIAIARITRDQAQDAGQRGEALNILGGALFTRGEWEFESDRLVETVDAFRKALLAFSRYRVPILWAKSQNNLGSAQLALGKRTQDTAMIHEAVKAHKKSLSIQTRERNPEGWALTQNNIGNAYLALGQLENGTDSLYKAVHALKCSLEIRTRSSSPLQWAMSQMNLGLALIYIGKRETGIERLQEANLALNASLEVRTRIARPIDWAMTQACMSKLQIALFDKTGEASLLDAAQAALEGAREVFLEARASAYLMQLNWEQTDIDARRR